MVYNMSATVNDFIKYLMEEVSNHSIYVWGGSGDLCKNVNEAWIRTKEARNEGGKHADDAVAAWNAVMNSAYKDVARVFDCSGYVSWCLIHAGALTGRKDCDGLYAMCNPTTELKDGTLLFRVNAKNPNDETHVGVYVAGKQYHSKGREHGVIAEKFNPGFWAKYGWFKGLRDEPDPEPAPTRSYVEVVGASVNVRSGYTSKSPIKFTAHKGQRYVYLETAPTGWYKISTEKGDCYISNLKRLTVLHATDEQMDTADKNSATAEKHVKVIGQSVNVRSSGDTSGTIVGIVHSGQIFPILDTANTGWYKIRFCGKDAYISNKPSLTVVVDG